MKYGYVSYMDILGFTSGIKSNDFETKYKNLIAAIRSFHPDAKATIYLISDSIIVTSKHLHGVKEYARMIYTWGMRQDFWSRGAITQGEYEPLDAAAIIEKNGNIIMPYLGDAYLRAVKLEEEINMAGIVIDSNVQSDNPGLPLEFEFVDGFMEYQEYLPKAGNENKKRLLLPSANEDIYITDSLHFMEMLKSHADDIDKYINTFCFYIKLFLTRTPPENMPNFFEQLLEGFSMHGRHFLIPRKVIIIFIAVIDALFERSVNLEKDYSEASLKADINLILDALKIQGYLPTFSDYLLELDKKRTTNLYEKVHDILSDGSQT